MGDARVALLVASCERYAAAALPPLLRSLRDAGVPAADVFVVAGECEPGAEADRAADRAGGFEVAELARPWANMDNNALAWAAHDPSAAARLAPYEWVFNTHDTTLVDAGFWDAVRARAAGAPPGVHAFRLYDRWSMSIGLYRLSALRDARVAARAPDLAPSLDRSPGAVLALKCRVEDQVFRALAAVHGGGAVGSFSNDYDVTARGADPYGTGTPRIAERYADPGLTKLKANWGEHAPHTML